MLVFLSFSLICLTAVAFFFCLSPIEHYIKKTFQKLGLLHSPHLEETNTAKRWKPVIINGAFFAQKLTKKLNSLNLKTKGFIYLFIFLLFSQITYNVLAFVEKINICFLMDWPSFQFCSVIFHSRFVSLLPLRRECFNSARPYCRSRRCCQQEISSFHSCSVTAFNLDLKQDAFKKHNLK